MFTPQNFGVDYERPTPKNQKTGQEVYFDGSKKNELNDLKKYLKSIVSDPEKQFYRREIIKKIISYTTSGVDTSRLYPQVVMASATKDPIEKKLIYLFLSIYSSSNQNFARLAINTFLKDISSPNPNVRALAARSLANLRFKGREEYALPTFMNGLNDFAPSVKRSCIMGLAKIAVEQSRINSSHPRDQTLLSKFYELLREEDASVVCTALQAINEVEQQGLSMSRKLAFYLIGNLHRFNDMQIPVIAGYLELYDPKSEQEVIEILTALEPRLKSSNSAAVLAISKVFLKAGKHFPTLMQKLLKSVRKSLLSFLHHQVPEIQEVVLRHVEYLIKTLKTTVFHGDYKQFMVGGNEPSYLRATKIRLLKLTASPFNFADIVNQLAQYLFDDEISHEAVKSLAELIGSSNETDARFIAKTVIKTIDTAPLKSLCDHTLPLVAGYLRLYPGDFGLFANVFYQLAENARQEDSRCALLEIIGDFGESIQQAPELINVISLSALSDRLRISLLRASTKLFLKRPAEMAQFLGKLLKLTLSDDETHLHIKDYAAYLYRGMQSGVEQFKKGFLEVRPHVASKPIQLQQLQFNSLEVIYNDKVEKWLLDPAKYLDIEQQIPEQAVVEHIEQPVRQIQVNLQSRFRKLQVQNFDVTFTMQSEQFQRHWQEYQVGSSITRMVNNIQVLGEDNLQELFKVWNITVLASAETQQEIKLYNYCKVQSEQGDLGVCCMQCVFSKLAETVALMIKSNDEQLAGFVSRYIEQILKLNEII